MNNIYKKREEKSMVRNEIILYNTENHPNLFCNIPFRSLYFNFMGDVFFCDNACELGMPPLGNVFDDRDMIREVWNGEMAQKFRASVYDGTYRYCGSYCTYFKSVTGPMSYIDGKNSRINDYLTQGISEKEREYIKNRQLVIDNLPTYLTFATTDKCNLKCRSCRTNYVTKDSKTEEQKKIYEKNRLSIIKNATVLLFGSYGEITMNDMDTEFLRTAKEEDVKNIQSIVIGTNGILFNKAYWESFADCIKKRVTRIEVSMDAAEEETYKINRLGGNWKILNDNIRFLSTLKKPWVQLNFCVQKNNYKEMVPFIRLGEKLGCVVHFQAIYNWGTFTEEEFRERNVADKNHPDYADFINEMKKEEFLSGNIVNDLGIGMDIEEKIAQSRIRKSIDSYPFYIYNQDGPVKYKLMGSNNGASMHISQNYPEGDFKTFKIEGDASEQWSGMFIVYYDIVELLDRTKSLNVKSAKKLIMTARADRDLTINELGIGIQGDSGSAKKFNVCIKPDWCEIEIDLGNSDLNDVNGLFYLSLENKSKWALYIKSIELRN
jgi:MoaA/NifB/PqqE/SkfB family radical SAM enzyme